jgi:hypothetical protein
VHWHLAKSLPYYKKISRHSLEVKAVIRRMPSKILTVTLCRWCFEYVCYLWGPALLTKLSLHFVIRLFGNLAINSDVPIVNTSASLSCVCCDNKEGLLSEYISEFRTSVPFVHLLFSRTSWHYYKTYVVNSERTGIPVSYSTANIEFHNFVLKCVLGTSRPFSEFSKYNNFIFIIAPCIMDSLNSLHTNNCTVIL